MKKILPVWFWKTSPTSVFIKQDQQLNLMETLKACVLDHPLIFLEAMEILGYVSFHWHWIWNFEFLFKTGFWFWMEECFDFYLAGVQTWIWSVIMLDGGICISLSLKLSLSNSPMGHPQTTSIKNIENVLKPGVESINMSGMNWHLMRTVHLPTVNG